MKGADAQVERLCRAAAQAPREWPVEAPFWLESRILAAWKSCRVEDYKAGLALIFRRAIVCAGLIILITAMFSLRSWNDPIPNELTVVESAIELTLMQ